MELGEVQRLHTQREHLHWEKTLANYTSGGLVSRNVHNANAKKTHPDGKWTN